MATVRNDPRLELLPSVKAWAEKLDKVTLHAPFVTIPHGQCTHNFLVHIVDEDSDGSHNFVPGWWKDDGGREWRIDIRIAANSADQGWKYMF